MTAPTPTSDISRDPHPASNPRASQDAPQGYLAASLGALVGVVVLAGLGIAIGVGLMELYHDPDAGLGNLALLLFPVGLGALGVLVGAFLGVRTALRRTGHEHATRTAWMTVPLTVLGLGLLVAWGAGTVVLLAMPAGARWLALRNAPTTP